MKVEGEHTGSETALKFSFVIVGKELLDLRPGGFVLRYIEGS